MERYRVAIIYASVTGNTEELAEMVRNCLKNYRIYLEVYTSKSFSVKKINHFDAIVVGTYTWGNGEIPEELNDLFNAIAYEGNKNIVTGVFGTGDSFYPHFCGAVDKFRDMLFQYTDLAVTLKVELRPQIQDKKRCRKFADLLYKRLLS
ncbi:flavodoxin domain-containing protein [Evansella tamaricis]|uniref:Flavodoxin domain-containing protein n=1 Tax=Evansella tamaricis TaxID=2069301 RepID=A0ABS6JF24_9BACI|nr:flavodoxin domain-containing protein [Evansella tamaricis]MBU9712285.1 flavodoxin domain-containing protein [Evansella tamaricis]